MLTPAVTTALNSAIENQKELPYNYYCLDEAGYLALASWIQGWRKYTAELLSIIKSYEKRLKELQGRQAQKEAE